MLFTVRLENEHRPSSPLALDCFAEPMQADVPDGGPDDNVRGCRWTSKRRSCSLKTVSQLVLGALHRLASGNRRGARSSQRRPETRPSVSVLGKTGAKYLRFTHVAWQTITSVSGLWEDGKLAGGRSIPYKGGISSRDHHEHLTSLTDLSDHPKLTNSLIARCRARSCTLLRRTTPHPLRTSARVRLRPAPTHRASSFVLPIPGSAPQLQSNAC